MIQTELLLVECVISGLAEKGWVRRAALRIQHITFIYGAQYPRSGLAVRTQGLIIMKIYMYIPHLPLIMALTKKDLHSVTCHTFVQTYSYWGKNLCSHVYNSMAQHVYSITALHMRIHTHRHGLGEYNKAGGWKKM